MDTRAYVDKASGKTLALIDGTVYEVVISTTINIGDRQFVRYTPNGPEYLVVRHTDDLVWYLVWPNFLLSERIKAHRHLRNKAIETRIDLFGTTILRGWRYEYPLPFDAWEYNFKA